MNLPSKPKLIVIAGPNGSGKTSITEQLLKHTWMQDCLYINPDRIAQDKFGDWNSPTAILAAAQYSQKIREECVKNQQSLAFETVMSGPDKLDYLLSAKKAGFFIRLFFIGTDTPIINAKRIAMRVLEGGHDVPINKIISRYSRSITNCITATHIADRAYVYDNSLENVEPTLLFRTADGKLTKKYDQINPWAKIIFNNLK